MTAVSAGGVQTISAKTATSVKTTGSEAAVEAAPAAMKTAAASARRHTVGHKHSKRYSRQQRDRRLAGHDYLQADERQGDQLAAAETHNDTGLSRKMGDVMAAKLK